MIKIKTLISKPEKSHAKCIYELVKKTKILDVNSEYLYLLKTTHFKDTCSVALIKDKVVGFASGYKLPKNPQTLFIWQVAVDERLRGQGLAKKLIENILNRKKNSNIKYINTTVSPSNKSSIKVFKKLAQELNTNIKSHKFIEKQDFTKEHEEEVLYEIGPIK